MKKKIYAMIPARIGSSRLKKKNLALLDGKPLIYYAIESAKRSKVFDKIYINSDDEIFKKVAEKYGVNFYLRPKKLGGSSIKSDQVVLDFIKKNKSDICVWVNSIAPLQTSLEIKKVINFFIKKNLNSLITVVDKKIHTVFKNNPVNFKYEGKFEQTQNLVPVKEMVYSLMMWKNNSFLKSMKIRGNAILHKKIGYYNVNPMSGLIVKNINDLKLIDQILKFRKRKNFKLKYYTNHK